MLRVVQAEGDAGTRGRTIGSELGDLIHRSLGFYRDYLADLGISDLAAAVAPYREAAQRSLPEHMETIAAMAAAAEVSEDELFAVNACEELEVLSLPSELLMITHDLSTGAHYADRIAVMYPGRIVEESPAHEVAHNPQHSYTRALLSVVPKRDPRLRSQPQILRGETPNSARIPRGCRFHPRCPMAIPDCEQVDPELRRPAAATTADHLAACIRV